MLIARFASNATLDFPLLKAFPDVVGPRNLSDPPQEAGSRFDPCQSH
jgi:hypothetical protein